MYGIIYVGKENAYQKYEEVKKEREEEYNKHNKPTDEFIDYFANKHHLSLPNDVVFDSDKLMEAMSKMSDLFPF